MQEALFDAGDLALAPGRAAGGGNARRQRPEDRFQVLHDLRLTAYHQAVAAIEPGNAAAGADVEIVKARRVQVPGAPDVVVVVGVAAVDDDVAGVQVARQFPEHRVDHAGRHRSQIARGWVSLATRPASESAPSKPSLRIWASAAGWASSTMRCVPFPPAAAPWRRPFDPDRSFQAALLSPVL